MSAHELIYINRCKELVEKRLNWEPSVKWKQRDYLDLIILIEQESNIALSLTTVKRLWRPDYNGTPHTATLEALAKFLGYQSWLDFKTDSSVQNSTRLRYQWLSQKRLLLSALMVVVVFVLFGIRLMNSRQEKTNTNNQVFRTEKVPFSVKNSMPFGVPNTVIFNYDLRGLQADSFFIQQSWNKYRKDLIKPESTTHTSIYYYPGVHQAKLLANQTTLAKTKIVVNTNDWVAAARFGMLDNVPTYIINDQAKRQGILSVLKNQLVSGKVEVKPDLIISYYYVNDFSLLDNHNFIFEARLKSDSLLNLTCPKLSVMILGENDVHVIPLTTLGCVGDITLKLAGQILRGTDHDLSSFGVNIYDWQQLKFQLEDRVVKISLMDKVVYTQPIDGGIGTIVGINFNFEGTGSVDHVILRNSKTKELVYFEDF